MNYSLNELAESLAERAGRQFDFAFREQLKLWINLWRSRLIRDSLNASPKDRQFFTSSLVLELEKVDDIADCGVVLRTKCKLPQPVRANSILFDYIGSQSMTSSYPLIQSHSLPYLDSGKYTRGRPKVSWIDNYLYVFNSPLLKVIRVHGIFEDLTKLGSCVKSANGSTEHDVCNLDDAPFPVSQDIQQRIIQSILSVELRIPSTQPDTEINLTNEDRNQTR